MAMVNGKQDLISRIVVLSLQGIGNSILLSPALITLRQKYPNSKITALVRFAACKDILLRNPAVSEVIKINLVPRSNLFSQLLSLIKLRCRRFDLSLTAFPANGLLFNVFAFLIGARLRFTHDYPTKKFINASFLQNRKVPLNNCHDKRQNLALVEACPDQNVVPHHSKNPKLRQNTTSFYRVTEREEIFTSKLVSELIPSCPKMLYGIHPGSSIRRKMSQKRWSREKFIILGKELIRIYESALFIFGGPEEKTLSFEITNAIGKNCYPIVNRTITEVAALIKECNLFVTNDSGLMHLAAAVKTPTVAIFGPTDPARTAPRTGKSVAVSKQLPCQPCWNLASVGRRKNCIYREQICLKELTVEEVLTAIERILTMDRVR